MSYTIIIGSSARKEIRRLSSDVIVRVNEKLKEFSETFDIQTPVPLGGNLNLPDIQNALVQRCWGVLFLSYNQPRVILLKTRGFFV